MSEIFKHIEELIGVFILIMVFHVPLQKKTAELNKLKEDLDVMKEKCELFLRQATGSPSAPTLSSELTVLVQSMSQVYSMSSIYMDK